MAWETPVAFGWSPRKISISSKYFGGFPLSAQVHLCTFYIQLLDVSPWFCTEDNLADNSELTFLCSSYCRYRHFCGYYSASPLFLLYSRLILRHLPLYQSTFLLSLMLSSQNALYLQFKMEVEYKCQVPKLWSWCSIRSRLDRSETTSLGGLIWIGLGSVRNVQI